MPTRKEVLMRSANLLNDFAFKYVFGEDCKEGLNIITHCIFRKEGQTCCCKEFRNGKRLY